MATLKVYSNEYGVRKVQEKVKFNFLEKAGYGIFVGVILLANVVMLNYKGELYSLRSAQQKNDVIISEKQKERPASCVNSRKTFGYRLKLKTQV